MRRDCADVVFSSNAWTLFSSCQKPGKIHGGAGLRMDSSVGPIGTRLSRNVIIYFPAKTF